jgi:hypothetical protein
MEWSGTQAALFWGTDVLPALIKYERRWSMEPMWTMRTIVFSLPVFELRSLDVNSIHTNWDHLSKGTNYEEWCLLGCYAVWLL